MTRAASDADLDLLAAIEDAADQQFIERFQPGRWDPATTGRARAAQPGSLLVATEEDRPVGFAHVLEVVGGAHLEQVAVLPAFGRRGHGRALVAAALAEAARRGYERVTLRTYADVPWNAPFYAALGFVETEPDTDHRRVLVDSEERLGLDRYGRRVQMTAGTGVGAPAIGSPEITFNGPSREAGKEVGLPLRTLLQADDVRRAITRMAHELVEHDPDAERLVLLGIPTRGAVLADRLGDQMTRIVGRTVPVGVLDVTLYRDDLAGQPTRATRRTDVPFDLDGATVVLVDDVLYSGRTVRAALDALTALGRPAVVRLAVLIDRGHRELPIRPDAVGRNLPSAKSERVRVRLTEVDGEDSVTIG